MNKKTKRIVNIVSIIVLFLLLVGIVIYALALKGLFAPNIQTLEEYGFRFESDSNIIEGIDRFADYNKYIFYGEIRDSSKERLSMLSTMMYNIQIMTALQKPFVKITKYVEQDRCLVFDSNTNRSKEMTTSDCISFLNEDSTGYLILDYDESLDTRKMVIEDNYYYLYSTDIDNLIQDNKDFLGIYISNLSSIESAISDFIGGIDLN